MKQETKESILNMLIYFGVWRYIGFAIWTVAMPFAYVHMENRFAFQLFLAMWCIGAVAMLGCFLIAIFDHKAFKNE